MSEQPFSRPLSRTNSRGFGSHPSRNSDELSEKRSQTLLNTRRFRLVVFAALIFISGLWLISRFGGHTSVVGPLSFGRRPINDPDSAAAAAVQLDGEIPAPPVLAQQQQEQVGLEAEIRAIIASHKVVVFSKTYCP